MDPIKGTPGADGWEQGFNYHCRDCSAEFESAESSHSNVEYPVCSAAGTRSITRL
jgi:DNA-directed RNA polymerase subunit RPC12/RpoP